MASTRGRLVMSPRMDASFAWRSDRPSFVVPRHAAAPRHPHTIPLQLSSHPSHSHQPFKSTQSTSICQALVYAGAGVVTGSTAASEWEEVHVKMKNFVSLFPCSRNLAPRPSPFSQLPNINALWSALLLEELLRSGLAHVVLCPGSRCAPLTVAVAQSGCSHTLANDERGAAFMALGFARASGRCAAVIVSSGTAVANLLPAVVEAHQVRSGGHAVFQPKIRQRPPEAGVQWPHAARMLACVKPSTDSSRASLARIECHSSC